MITRSILAVLVAAAWAGSASAQLQPLQPIAPAPRPVISPYLNLLRNGAPAYLNYYGLVQPQLQAQSQFNQLSQQVNTLQNTPQSTYPGTGSELVTGKQVGFFTHRGYFMNMGGYGVSRGTTGQYSTMGSNTVNQPQQQNSSIMPYRR